MSSRSAHSTSSASPGSTALAWIFLAIGIALAVAGVFFNWYQAIAWFDEVIHFYNFFAVTLVILVYMYGSAGDSAPQSTGQFVLKAIAISLVLGVLWEVAEYVYDQFFSQQNTIKSGLDRLIDLVLDGLGGLVAGLVALRMIRK